MKYFYVWISLLLQLWLFTTFAKQNTHFSLRLPHISQSLKFRKLPQLRYPTNSPKPYRPTINRLQWNQMVNFNRRLSNLRNAFPLRKPARKQSPAKVESRQLGLIRTLFRYPLLLVFSNLFSLPLLPTLLLASPILNSLPQSGQASTSAAQPYSVNAAAISNGILSLLSNNTSGPLSANGFIGAFISDMISDLQAGSSMVNDFLQGLSQTPVKPNRVSIQDTARKPGSVPSSTPSSVNVTQVFNDTDSVALSVSDGSVSNVDFASAPSNGNSLLNQLATSLVESSKKHQINEAMNVEKLQIGNSAHELVEKVTGVLRVRRKRTEAGSIQASLEVLANLVQDKKLMRHLTSALKVLASSHARSSNFCSTGSALCLYWTHPQIRPFVDAIAQLALQQLGDAFRKSQTRAHRDIPSSAANALKLTDQMWQALRKQLIISRLQRPLTGSTTVKPDRHPTIGEIAYTRLIRRLSSILIRP